MIVSIFDTESDSSHDYYEFMSLTRDKLRLDYSWDNYRKTTVRTTTKLFTWGDIKKLFTKHLSVLEMQDWEASQYEDQNDESEDLFFHVMLLKLFLEGTLQKMIDQPT